MGKFFLEVGNDLHPVRDLLRSLFSDSRICALEESKNRILPAATGRLARKNGSLSVAGRICSIDPSDLAFSIFALGGGVQQPLYTPAGVVHYDHVAGFLPHPRYRQCLDLAGNPDRLSVKW